MGRWILSGSRRWYFDRPSARGMAGREEVRFKDAASAKRFLQFSLGDQMAVHSLRSLLAGEGFELLTHRMGDEEVLHEVARRLAGRRLSLWQEPKRATIGGAGTAVLPPVVEAAPSKPVKSPEKEPEKSWIEIVLMDDSGAPVPNERYVLELPNGAVKSGVLDRHGRALVNGIDPGSCKVTFPDFDGREWKAA